MKHLNIRSDTLNPIKDKVENSLEPNGTRLSDENTIAERLRTKISKEDIMKQKLLHRSKDTFIMTKGQSTEWE